MILYRFLSVVVVILVLFLSAVFPPDLRPAHAASGSVALPEERLLIDPIFARPGSAYLAIGFIDRTRYLLALDVDFAAGQVSGLAHILFVNTTKQPLSTVVFRLYPNRPRFSVADGIFTRRMSIDTVTVDGNAASSQVSDPFETVLTISLAAPIPPAGKAVIEIGYQIALPHTPDYMDLWDPYPLL